MRLFIAIELPDRVKHTLAGLCRELPGVRWVPREQLHLTLQFLGEVAEEELEPLCQALAAIRVQPFSLRLTRPGCFPRPAALRVLWFGIDEQPALERLAGRVRDAVAACGIAVEERPFTPHITLARVRQQPALAELKQYLDHPAHLKVPPITVTGFVLFQSRLSSHGAEHLPVRVFSCEDRVTTHE